MKRGRLAHKYQKRGELTQSIVDNLRQEIKKIIDMCLGVWKLCWWWVNSDDILGPGIRCGVALR